MNLIQIHKYQIANDILFVLDSISKNAGTSLSKLGLQKILYLAKVLEPIKDTIISTLEFLTEKRGPYSKEVQNIVDHLASLDFVTITDFKILFGKNSLAFYEITPVGQRVVKSLKEIPVQEEKCWWIDVISRLTIIYSKKVGLEDKSNLSELDRIVKLVYKDPTYNCFKGNGSWKYSIDFESTNEKTTKWMIEYVKNYIENNNLILTKNNIRGNAELITISFFEYYYFNYLKNT